MNATSPSTPAPEAISDDELQRYEALQRQALDCARAGETEVLRAMLAAGMPINLRDAKGNTLLMLACYHQHLEAAELLLARGADPDLRNDRGQTPLGGAAFKGYNDIVTLLLRHGAEINADQGGGKTPLFFATLFGRLATRRLLRQSGAVHWRRPSDH